MLFFRKRETALPEQLLAFMETDLHSHLLPGIDDGVQNIATAITFITALQGMGIKKIITTPHIIMDRYPNSRETMSAPYHEVKSALAEKNIPVSFHHAAEYYLDEQFIPLLGKPLLTLSGNLVLVEISFMSAPPQLHQLLFDIQAAGYQPVMAHPERYAFYHKNPDAYQQLKRWGCHLQLNLLSLTGYYGRHVQQAAEMLIAGSMIEYIGTDLHHEKHLQAIIAIGKNKKLQKILEAYPFRNRELTTA